MHLFHSIGENGAESAAVRKFIVDHNLKDKIEFHNVAYEESQAMLKAYSHQTKTPCLVADKKVLVGAKAITEFLS